MDWNIFFSTFAQSIAIIIGLYGAFILNVIFNTEKEFKTKSKLLIKYLADSKLLKEKAILLPFPELIYRIRRNIFRFIIEDIRRDGVKYSIVEYIKNYGYCAYDELNLFAKKIEKLIEESNKSGTISEETYRSYTKTLLDEEPENENDIHNIQAEISKQIIFNSSLLFEIRNSDYSLTYIKKSLIALFVFFIIGVIYPISFIPLPLSDDINITFFAFFEILLSFKGLLLSIAVLSYLSIMIIFWRSITKLKFNEMLINSLMNYCNMSEYHYYLGVWYKNQNRKINVNIEKGYK